MCLILTETWFPLIQRKYASSLRGIPQYEESIVAGFLDNLGYCLEYERKYENVTPDWTILDSQSNPIGIIEVLSINEDQNEVVISQPQVNDLRTKLHKIDVGVILNITIDDKMVRLKNLTSSVNKKIATTVEFWLKNESPKKGDLKIVENIEFEFVSYHANLSHVKEFIIKPKELIGHFDIYGEIEKTKKKILQKIRKYKELSIQENLFFTIGLIANSLVVKNKQRVDSIIDEIFRHQESLSSVIIFNKIAADWEVRINNNPKAWIKF